LAVDIFGVGSDLDKIKRVIRGKKISIISDSAQSPYFFYKKKLAGTQSEIGGYSLNCHKHINTGEGGILVTNNKKIANRVFKLRNHAEASVGIKDDISNMLGYNFRMGEIECAIGIEQYKKLKKIIFSRNKLLNKLAENLEKLKGIRIPTSKIKLNNYYVFPIVLNIDLLRVSRKKILTLLKAEGVEGLVEGYANIHQLPVFKRKIAYGKKGFPWNIYNKKIDYKKSLCPVAEELHEKSFLSYQVCLFSYTNKDIRNISKAFYKVWKYLNF